MNAGATAAPGAPHPVQVLGNLATIEPGAELGTVSHYDVQPVLDIYANVNGTDLGTVTRSMDQIIEKHRKELPRGSQFILRGQSDTMRKSYVGLIGGLAMSILLVYLLIVVNFQSWLDPFLIISALPAALAGIVWSCSSPTPTSVCRRSPAPSCAWAWPPPTPSLSSVLPANSSKRWLAMPGRPL